MELDGSTYCRGFHGHPAFHVRSRDCMISNTGVRTCVVYLQTVQGFQEVTMTSIDYPTLLHQQRPLDTPCYIGFNPMVSL